MSKLVCLLFDGHDKAGIARQNLRHPSLSGFEKKKDSIVTLSKGFAGTSECVAEPVEKRTATSVHSQYVSSPYNSLPYRIESQDHHHA